MNAEALERYTSVPASLDAVQARIVDDLRRDGIARSHLNELFSHEKLLELQTEAERLELVATPNTKKTFLTQLIPLYPEIDLEDPFVRFGLSNTILDCVSAYLGLWPKLYYYTLGITNPVELGAVPRQSQRWHRDPEDRKMCKVFIYLTDVDATSGPFHYVKGSIRGGRWGSLYPQQPPAGSYPPLEEVERRVSSEDILSCTAPAGTVIFADTSGLHKGGYATGKRRIMSTTGFVTQAATKGVFYTRGEDFEQKMGALSPTAVFALKNTKIANRDWKY